METVIINNLKETKELAKRFAKILKGGEVILLNGDLGAGKTTFVKCILKNLGVKDDVTSPTFTIMKEYKTKRFDIYHFDMYRLASGSEAVDFGLEEYIFSKSSNGLVFIEWSENIKDILQGKYIEINISLIEDGKRKFEIIRG